ncbi:DUF4058 family protein [Alienimonas sp. DA493]|uniref:DUF4058 family protein n=1 Tax=Alienimonas sp. DA493 TaxID=3373605 RepID=UPI0037551ACE
MPSPFPGMDPFLEGEPWHSFHQAFAATIAEVILRTLPDRYYCRLESHVYLHERSAEQRRLLGRSDAGVMLLGGEAPAPGTTPTSANGVLLASPRVSHVPPAVDEQRENYVTVRNLAGDEVVCVLELLSPTNKRRGPDREVYLQKRYEYLRGNAHLIEIDLHRIGERMPIADEVPEPYLVSVSQVEARPSLALWPIALRDPLPSIPVPLGGGDAPLTLDLAEAFTLTYDRGGHARGAYRRPPVPPLSPEDAAWAAGLLTDAGIPLPPGFPPDEPPDEPADGEPPSAAND